MVQLYDALKASYKPKDKLGKKGQYIKDKSLSNDNEQVYYNKKKKKLLYTVSGTHNLKDWGTDFYLGLGKLKDTNRYKEADEVLKKAKEKYHPRKTIGAGHSLGALVSYLPVDKSYTLDKGATLFQPTQKNEKSYRTKGDIVSMFGTGMKTLKNPNINTGLLPIDAYRAHNVDNIKTSKIFL